MLTAYSEASTAPAEVLTKKHSKMKGVKYNAITHTIIKKGGTSLLQTYQDKGNDCCTNTGYGVRAAAYGAAVADDIRCRR